MPLTQPEQYSSRTVSESKSVLFLQWSFPLFSAGFFLPPGLPEEQRRLICEHGWWRALRGGTSDFIFRSHSSSRLSLNIHLSQDTVPDKAQLVFVFKRPKSRQNLLFMIAIKTAINGKTELLIYSWYYDITCYMHYFLKQYVRWACLFCFYLTQLGLCF